MEEKKRALALLSGGLDSTLAARLILDQGIDVVAVNFVSPFCLCRRGGCGAPEVARQLGVPLKVISAGREYLNIVQKPKHGYGKNMNPCIDCRIFMLKRAKRYAKEIGASFIFTGEVLDQRPMSQHYKTLRLIEEEAGLKGRLLRPLSAKLLPETLAEKKRLVRREELLGVRGRSRRPQLSLVKRFDLTDCACPSGGCLLAEKEFAARLRDLFHNKKRITLNDVKLLKIGRHFRLGENKIVVGRNETENKTLHSLKSEADYSFEILGCGSPVTILLGPKTRKTIAKAAALTAYYSDTKSEMPTVNFGKDDLHQSIRVPVPKDAEVEELRIRSRD